MKYRTSKAAKSAYQSPIELKITIIYFIITNKQIGVFLKNDVQ